MAPVIAWREWGAYSRAVTTLAAASPVCDGQLRARRRRRQHRGEDGEQRDPHARAFLVTRWNSRLMAVKSRS